jgi:hypothetical protein
LERFAVASIFVMWLYLFLPFRLFRLPPLFGQAEEWTVSCIMLSITGLCLFASFFRKKRLTFRLTVCDLLLLFYLIYSLFRLDSFHPFQEHIRALLVLVLLYMSVRISGVRRMKCIIPVLVFSLFVQASHALLFQAGAKGDLSELSGIFHNTGIRGGFAAMVSAGVFGMILCSGRNKTLLSVLFPLSLVLPACSQSCAAWIVAACGIVFSTFFFLREKYGSGMLLPAIAAIVLFAPAVLYGGRMLYRMKPVSADGRMYIWKNERYSRADSLTAVFMQKERKVRSVHTDRMMKDVREWAEERRLAGNGDGSDY